MTVKKYNVSLNYIILTDTGSFEVINFKYKDGQLLTVAGNNPLKMSTVKNIHLYDKCIIKDPLSEKRIYCGPVSITNAKIHAICVIRYSPGIWRPLTSGPKKHYEFPSIPLKEQKIEIVADMAGSDSFTFSSQMSKIVIRTVGKGLAIQFTPNRTSSVLS